MFATVGKEQHVAETVIIDDEFESVLVGEDEVSQGTCLRLRERFGSTIRLGALVVV